MTIPRQSASQVRRDASLRRLRRFNRGLAAAMVALTLFLANAAARGFAGHPRAGAQRTIGTEPSARSERRRRPASRSARHRSHHTERGTRDDEASAAGESTTSTGAQAPATTNPAASAAQTIAPPASPPQAASAPAAVVSGGS